MLAMVKYEDQKSTESKATSLFDFNAAPEVRKR